MSDETMSYAQACQMATQLRSQGQTFPKIAEHFRKIGYTSSRTKKPPGELAVRHMVIETEKKRKGGGMIVAKKRQLDPDETGDIMLSSPTFRDTVLKVASLSGINDSTFLSLMKALVEQHERTLQTK